MISLPDKVHTRRESGGETTLLQKIVHWIISVVGAGTAVFAVYINYSQTEFSQELSSREAMTQSFNSQIESLKERGHEEKAEQLQIEKEKFEENWRNSQRLSYLTREVSTLSKVRLDQQKVGAIEEILESDRGWYLGSEQLKVVGDAYFATELWDEASSHYKMALQARPKNEQVYALYGLSLLGQAEQEQDVDVKRRLQDQSDDWLMKAKNAGVVDREALEQLIRELGYVHTPWN